MTDFILSLIRGVPKVPQDSLSAEIGLDVIDLLDPNGLMVDFYDIQIPNLKNNATWADNPTTDGRTLQSGALGNLTESLRLNLNVSTQIQKAAILAKLGKFRQYINDFWANQDIQERFEPVYIKHQVAGEPGPRYALLYNLDIHVNNPILQDTPNCEIVLSIEREPFWNWLAPGDNPKRWTIENYFTGQKWDASKASLITGGDHLATGLVDNCQEFLTTTTFQSRNFLDISADKIPGDAPPKVCITVDSPEGFSTNMLIGVSTNRTTVTDRNNAALPLYNSFPCSGSSLQSVTAAYTTDNGRGIAHVPLSPNRRTVVVTPVSAAEVDICFWTTGATLLSHLNPFVLKGRYAVFLRASQIGGTAGTVSARLRFTATTGDFYDSGLRVIDDANGSGLNYMGTVELPPDEHATTGLLGKGVTAEYDFRVMLSTMRASGAGTIRLIDVVLFPLGNYVYIQPVLDLTSGYYLFYDDTGYMTHGRNDAPVAGARTISGNNETNATTELAGRLELTPGVNNRVYFLDYYTGGSGSLANADMTPRINIVPRSTSYRTE